MFEYLSSFDYNIVQRYDTIIKNLRANSPSFYDSYLNCIESFVKYIATTESIPFEKNDTCGKILKSPQMSSFLIETAKISPTIISKVSDYISKINSHKHSSQKIMDNELVVNYMRAFFDFSSNYAIYKGFTNNLYFDSEDFLKIIGAYTTPVDTNDNSQSKSFSMLNFKIRDYSYFSSTAWEEEYQNSKKAVLDKTTPENLNRHKVGHIINLILKAILFLAVYIMLAVFFIGNSYIVKNAFTISNGIFLYNRYYDYIMLFASAGVIAFVGIFLLVSDIKKTSKLKYGTFLEDALKDKTMNIAMIADKYPIVCPQSTFFIKLGKVIIGIALILFWFAYFDVMDHIAKFENVNPLLFNSVLPFLLLAYITILLGSHKLIRLYKRKTIFVVSNSNRSFIFDTSKMELKNYIEYNK